MSITLGRKIGIQNTRNIIITTIDVRHSSIGNNRLRQLVDAVLGTQYTLRLKFWHR